MHRIAILLVAVVAAAVSPQATRLCAETAAQSPTSGPKPAGQDYSKAQVIARPLSGNWRPFLPTSPWNSPIGREPQVHADSAAIIATITAEAKNLRFANYFVPPLWVVNADNMPQPAARARYAFDTWDQNNDGVTDCGVPLLESMWGEQTSDGHIIVIDPFRNLCWELSRYTGFSDGRPQCSTFNVWDLADMGIGDGREGERWWARGGRGSGFPVIAGLVRPEEIETGRIRHALVCTFSKNRADEYLPPACRTDGDCQGREYPGQGMLLQLDPLLSEADFQSWGLTRDGMVVARALQEYGLYIGDNGGAMAMQAQLLDPDTDKHLALWESRCPGLFDSAARIPTHELRVLHTGAALRGGDGSRVVTPLVTPQGGGYSTPPSVTITTPTPGARIFFTLDGSLPTEAAPEYRGPIVIRRTAELRARAYRGGMVASGTTRAPFRIRDSTR